MPSFQERLPDMMMGIDKSRTYDLVHAVNGLSSRGRLDACLDLGDDVAFN